MRLFIDDLRDPTKTLPEELKGDDIIWIKDWWGARNFLMDNKDNLEVVFFDHFLEGSHTGSELFTMVMFEKTHGGSFPKLKTLYLHSSFDDVDELMDYKDELAKHGVELIRLNLNVW